MYQIRYGVKVETKEEYDAKKALEFGSVKVQPIGFGPQFWGILVWEEIKQLWIRPCLSLRLLLACFCLLAFQRVARSCCNRHFDASGFFGLTEEFLGQNLLIWSPSAACQPKSYFGPVLLLVSSASIFPVPPSPAFWSISAPALRTFTTSRFLYLSLLARSLFKTSMHLWELGEL